MAPFGNKNAVGNRGGRPTLYEPDDPNKPHRPGHPTRAYRLALLGLTDQEIWESFGISEDTFYEWQNVHPEFSESLQEGKEPADAKVVDSLRQRALGYSHPEDKVFCTNGEVTVVPTIKHYPPDTAAAFIWLKNRQGKHWRDRQEISIETGNPVERLSSLLGIPVETINERLEMEKVDHEDKLRLNDWKSDPYPSNCPCGDYSRPGHPVDRYCDQYHKESVLSPLSSVERQINGSLRSMRKDNIKLIEDEED